MDTELTLDVGQANEFKLACRRAGYTNADIKRMCEGDVLARVLPVLRGQAEVTGVQHVIDCDAAPLIPYDGWKVEEHKKGGQFTWDPSKLSLYLSDNQRGDRSIEGNKLRRELAERPVLNVNVLDYLIRHPHLVPEEWKVDEEGNTRCIYFWGTIYRLSGGYLCVRYLCFWGGYWDWGSYWVLTGVRGARRFSSQAELWILAPRILVDPWNFVLEPFAFAHRAHFFIFAFCIYSFPVVGDYAGGYGFPLPNPVSIHSE